MGFFGGDIRLEHAGARHWAIVLPPLGRHAFCLAIACALAAPLVYADAGRSGLSLVITCAGWALPLAVAGAVMRFRARR